MTGIPKFDLESFRSFLKINCERDTSRYWQVDEFDWQDFDFYDLFIAVDLELYREVTSTTAFRFGRSFKQISASCVRSKFDLERMIAEQFRVGKRYEELKRIHAIGNDTISSILRRQGEAKSPGRRPLLARDQKIFETLEANEWNASKTARDLNMHRTTVTSVLRRHPDWIIKKR